MTLLFSQLGSNENPLGCSACVLRAVGDACAHPQRYPDRDGAAFRSALANHHGVSGDEVTTGAGATALIAMAARAFGRPGDEVLTPRASFAWFGEAARLAGRVHHEAELGSRFSTDLDALADACGPRTRVIFLANPGNPTGAWCAAPDLARFLRRVPPEVVVVLDEAYADFAPEPAPGMHLRAQRERLVVLRTFSKAHGLAGLRVGYAVGGSREIAAMAELREPFCVTRIAAAAALAALSDRAHLARTRRFVEGERARIGRALADLGLDVAPCAASFLLVGTNRPAARVAAALLGAGVGVRPLDAYGLPGHLRVSVGREEDNDRLLAAVAEVLPEIPAEP
ncbi:MAG: pyridoxal phosphate-dependent aminotransferase [Myxococcota bacterium]